MQRNNRRYAGRSPGRGPSRTWVSLLNGWTFTAVTVTTLSPLMALEAPANVTALTSDPPEDLTVLRVVGEFNVTISTTGSWILAVLVQDATWTPGTYATDSDKRILWARAFTAPDAQQYAWTPLGVLTAGANAPVAMNRDTITIDIAPKVKIGPGQALYLVAYETAGASTLTVSNHTLRLLFQRSGRR